jgi:hypothetical protein
MMEKSIVAEEDGLDVTPQGLQLYPFILQNSFPGPRSDKPNSSDLSIAMRHTPMIAALPGKCL